ncbi:MAG: glycosyltransferase [Ardenticatenia bacterium]|nr:glycosyltransferase [Ardenticatenia bacterium]
MDILHLYKDYHPVLGGIENHMKVLAEAQVAAGTQVTVLVCSPGRRTQVETLNGVRIIKAGRLATVASMPLSLAQLLALRRMKPDVVHIHSPYPLGEMANWLWGRGRATVITYHSDVVRQRGWLRLYAPVLRRVLEAVDRIIVDSQPYIDTSTWLQAVRHKCVAVPIGVDAQRFVPSPRTPLDKPAVLFVGRLRYYKGLDVLLRALASTPEIQLLVVGDGPMRGVWEALAQELGLSDQVCFAGDVDDADLPRWYQKADVFVLPSNSRAEAYGIVLLEAMASGLPCIATELGTGTSWIVQDGTTGIVVPPEDPLALAGAMAGLLEDPDLCRSMGRAGRERVERHFSVERMTRGVEDVYQSVLAQAGY